MVLEASSTVLRHGSSRALPWYSRPPRTPARVHARSGSAPPRRHAGAPRAPEPRVPRRGRAPARRPGRRQRAGHELAGRPERARLFAPRRRYLCGRHVRLRPRQAALPSRRNVEAVQPAGHRRFSFLTRCPSAAGTTRRSACSAIPTWTTAGVRAGDAREGEPPPAGGGLLAGIEQQPRLRAGRRPPPWPQRERAHV